AGTRGGREAPMSIATATLGLPQRDSRHERHPPQVAAATGRIDRLFGEHVRERRLNKEGSRAEDVELQPRATRQPEFRYPAIRIAHPIVQRRRFSNTVEHVRSGATHQVEQVRLRLVERQVHHDLRGRRVESRINVLESWHYAALEGLHAELSAQPEEVPRLAPAKR